MDFSYFDTYINGTNSKASKNKVVSELTQNKGFTVDHPTSYRESPIEQNRDNGHFASGYHRTGESKISDKEGDSHTRTTENYGVDSTAVESARYDPEDNSLNITYKGGSKEYKFAADPKDVMDWVNAPSKGRLTEEWKQTHRYPGY